MLLMKRWPTPVKRRQHDEWIKRMEDALATESSAAFGTDKAEATRTPPPNENDAVELHIRRYWWIYGVGALIVWAALSNDSGGRATPAPAPTFSAPPNSVPIAHPSPASRPAPVVQAAYVRAAYAPNGEPWPARSGYVNGYKRLRLNGLSKLTIDNTQNDSDVFVKLLDIRGEVPLEVRTFFIKAGDQFTLSSIRAGTYDIRYRDLDSGAIAKSPPFELEETAVDGGVQYSEMRMTLYKVRGGNMRMQRISESEF